MSERKTSAAERTNALLRASYEALSGLIEGVERRIGARFDRLEDRVTLLENVARKLHDEVERAELARLSALEHRVTMLEKRRAR